MLRTFGHRVAMCCEVLGVVGSNLTIFKFEPTVPNMLQHIATRWPNARNMLPPAMLRYVALACCYRLAGTLNWITGHYQPLCCRGLTGRYQSGDDGLTKSVKFFQYFYWLLGKSFFKSKNRKFSDCCYSMGRHMKYSRFSPKPHTLWCANIWRKCLNPINLHTLLIHLNRCKSCKNKL